MRRANGDPRPVNNTLQTITAAADAIAAVDHRFPRATTVQILRFGKYKVIVLDDHVRKACSVPGFQPIKRRWGSCWSIYWCFGSLKQRKRIEPAVLVPEPSPTSEAPENILQSTDIVFPFAAPPSSPASFLHSEPPSAAQSPTAVLSFTSLTANMYSLDGPSSIFAIGPFAHETQLVSPPLNFSTLTTEPSTAPFTPPESFYLTTPSSPEVPFAQFLQPNLQKAESDQQYSFPNDEFQSYQYDPGSPVSHLISPRSVISRSGASSPLPDCDFASSGSLFSNFPIDGPPKLLNLGKHSIHDWRSQQSFDSFARNSVGFKSSDDLVLNSQTSEPTLDQHATNECQNTQILVDGNQKEECATANHRFSFELSDEDALRPIEDKLQESNKLTLPSLIDEPPENVKENSSVGSHTSNDREEKATADGEEAQRHQKHHSITLGSVKEFNFHNGNGSEPKINSGWWTNEEVAKTEDTTTGDWSFFPMTQPS